LPYHGANATYMPLRIRSNYRGNVGGVFISTNRYGLRDEPDFEPVPAAGEFRILSMGDSIAFGLGIKSSDSYAKVLERKLNETDGPAYYRVINAAGPGYSPSSYYLFLKNEALQWHPRLVLIEIELTNDVSDEALLRWVEDPQHPGTPERLKGGRYVVGWDGILLSAYIRGPYFYEKTYTYAELSRRILSLLFRIRPTEPFSSDPSVTYYAFAYEHYLLDQKKLESGWTRMFGALQATNEILRRNKIPFLLMIMPSRFIFTPDPDGHRDLFSRNLVERAVELARQKGIPFFNLTETIASEGGAELFIDSIHLNERGNLAVGSALFEHLRGGVQ
jgi:lysophospholipase L1-like esterase